MDSALSSLVRRATLPHSGRVFVALLVAGCATDPDENSLEPVSIQIDAPMVALAPGGSTALTATVLDSRGRPLTGAVVRWTSSNSASVRVSSNGIAEAVGRGAAMIGASVGDLADTVQAIVGAFASLTAGGEGTCGRTTIGELVCWGNPFGADSSGVPAPVENGQSLRSPSLGMALFCAIDSTGQPGCRSDLEFPPPTFGAEQFDSLVAGSFHACALRRDGTIQCSGQIYGHGGVAWAEPLILAASGGESFQCVLGISRSAYCWGEGRYGQLGDGVFHQPGDDAVPPSAVLGGWSYESLAAGFHHACGLTAMGEVYCWGEGGFGQLGDGLATSSPVPVRVASTRVYRQLTAGWSHTCALAEGGILDCWGGGAFGELGDGGVGLDEELRRVTPGPVAGGHRWIQVAAGAIHTCGLADDGFAYCWGWGSSGQLGDGQVGEDHGANLPVQVL